MSIYGGSWHGSRGYISVFARPASKPQIKVKPPKPVAQWFIEHGKSNPWDMNFTNPTTGKTRTIRRRDYENALRVTLPSYGRVILVDDVLKTIDARNAAIEKVTVSNGWGKNRKSSTKGRARVCQAFWRNGHMVKSR